MAALSNISAQLRSLPLAMDTSHTASHDESFTDDLNSAAIRSTSSRAVLSALVRVGASSVGGSVGALPCLSFEGLFSRGRFLIVLLSVRCNTKSSGSRLKRPRSRARWNGPVRRTPSKSPNTLIIPQS